MDPIDYSSAFSNVVSPYAAVVGGMKDGIALQQLQAERQQTQAKLAQQQQQQADLQALAANPTTAGIAQLSIKYPGLSESFKRSFDILDPQEQRTRLEQAMPVYMALDNNKPEIAAQVLREQATALRNGGREDQAKAAEAKAKLIEDNPAAAKIGLGGLLAAAIGPDKFAKMAGDIGDERRAQEQAPAELDKKVADASTAKSEATLKGAQAKNAVQLALLDLQKKGWDIKNIESEIGARREQNRIAAMNAALGRETNDLKRQELGIKIQEAQTALQDKVRAKVADAESAATNIDNMLNTIVRVKQHPGLDSVVGSIQGRLPAVISDENADAIALIDTLGSQAFLSLVPTMKGQGSLSNAEGEKLQAALQNLKRAQSETQFKANLDEAARILTKGRANVSKRYGVPLGNPDTPAAPLGTRPPLSSFGG
jgi:hypothetical protein